MVKENAPDRLLVEGSDDKWSIINLMKRHGLDWGDTNERSPYVNTYLSCDGEETPRPCPKLTRNLLNQMGSGQDSLCAGGLKKEEEPERRENGKGESLHLCLLRFLHDSAGSGNHETYREAHYAAADSPGSLVSRTEPGQQ